VPHELEVMVIEQMLDDYRTAYQFKSVCLRY